MRINQYIAFRSGLSRRAADEAILAGQVKVNDQLARVGYEVNDRDLVTLNGKVLHPIEQHVVILLNKPIGYVVSRQGQGNKTIYSLLPPTFHKLKPVGRLDKQSSGLLLMTNNGMLANELTHPSHQKAKVYEARLNKPLSSQDRTKIEIGVLLNDGPSSLKLDPINNSQKVWRITMKEGRNRQIRRTFQSLGYAVVKLHRTHFGKYSLANLSAGAWTIESGN